MAWTKAARLCLSGDNIYKRGLVGESMVGKVLVSVLAEEPGRKCLVEGATRRRGAGWRVLGQRRNNVVEWMQEDSGARSLGQK
ncbi:uncharacterized protein A4U43_C07F18580 [Asparagus officinalis]|uniref:Uncharacterized protein n=1 Tax=Asparagus officinalis TaxID=4686 RepID=A0A5P1EDB0_ASPOF|nr:uncharacterized protein A4U43_C07F18580 [Asparagus officinalis]